MYSFVQSFADWRCDWCCTFSNLVPWVWVFILPFYALDIVRSEVWAMIIMRSHDFFYQDLGEVFSHCCLGQNVGCIVKRDSRKPARPLRSVLSTHLWHVKRFSMARSCPLAPRGVEQQTSSFWWRPSIAAATRFHLPRWKVAPQVMKERSFSSKPL